MEKISPTDLKQQLKNDRDDDLDVLNVLLQMVDDTIKGERPALLDLEEYRGTGLYYYNEDFYFFPRDEDEVYVVIPLWWFLENFNMNADTVDILIEASDHSGIFSIEIVPGMVVYNGLDGVLIAEFEGQRVEFSMGEEGEEGGEDEAKTDDAAIPYDMVTLDDLFPSKISYGETILTINGKGIFLNGKILGG